MTMTLAPAASAACAPATPVARDHRRRHARQQQRLVADLRGAVAMRVDQFRSGKASAIAAAQTERPLAGVLQHFCKHHRRRRLAGPAKREIADAQHRRFARAPGRAIRRAAMAP